MIDIQDTLYVVQYLKKRNAEQTLKLAKSKLNKLAEAIAHFESERTNLSAEQLLEIVESTLDQLTLSQLKTAIRASKYRDRNKQQRKHSYQIDATTQAKIIEIKQMLGVKTDSKAVVEYAIEHMHMVISHYQHDDDLNDYVVGIKKYNKNT